MKKHKTRLKFNEHMALEKFILAVRERLAFENPKNPHLQKVFRQLDSLQEALDNLLFQDLLGCNKSEVAEHLAGRKIADIVKESLEREKQEEAAREK